MNRRDFLLKLGKSVLVITAVTVTGRFLSKKEAEECEPESSCAGCSSFQRCGLPKRNAYLGRNNKLNNPTEKR